MMNVYGSGLKLRIVCRREHWEGDMVDCDESFYVLLSSTRYIKEICDAKVPNNTVSKFRSIYDLI
jgi:hypothetical protein